MKLIVGGCSVSDYTPSVDRVYGEILAEKIGADYIHHGAGCGSNYRTWRNITEMVMNNEIDENDILLIQYTEVCRQEFWSAIPIEEENARGDKIKLRDKKYDGDIIRFKPNLVGYQNLNKYEQKLFKLKESYFISPDFDLERFEYNHYLFHNTIVSKNIKIAYIVPTGQMKGYGWHFRDRFNKNGEIHITEGLDFKYPSEYLYDHGHWGQLGHEYVANILEKFIKKEQWL